MHHCRAYLTAALNPASVHLVVTENFLAPAHEEASGSGADVAGFGEQHMAPALGESAYPPSV